MIAYWFINRLSYENHIELVTFLAIYVKQVETKTRETKLIRKHYEQKMFKKRLESNTEKNKNARSIYCKIHLQKDMINSPTHYKMCPRSVKMSRY